MIQKNILFSLCIAFASYSLIAIGEIDKDAFGRTPLMNYVIEQEKIYKEFSIKFQAIEKSRELNQIQKEAEQAAMITEFNTWITKTKHDILKMIAKNEKQQLSAQDNDGNTVINFTTNTGLYKFLREQGAPFQFLKWWSVNHGNIELTLLWSKISLAAFMGSLIVAPEYKSLLEFMHKSYSWMAIGMLTHDLYTKP